MGFSQFIVCLIRLLHISSQKLAGAVLTTEQSTVFLRFSFHVGGLSLHRSLRTGEIAPIWNHLQAEAVDGVRRVQCLVTVVHHKLEALNLRVPLSEASSNFAGACEQLEVLQLCKFAH